MKEFDKTIADKLNQVDYPVDHEMWDAIESSLGKAPSAASNEVSFMPSFIAGTAVTAAIVTVLSLMPVGESTHPISHPAEAHEVTALTEDVEPNQESSAPVMMHTAQEEHEIELIHELPQVKKELAPTMEKTVSSEQEHPKEENTELNATHSPSIVTTIAQEVSFRAIGIQCAGSTVLFKAETKLLADIKWIIDGVHVLEGTEIEYSFDDAGDHEVVMLSIENGNSVSTKRVIQIYERPEGSLSYTVEGNNQCFGQNVQLKAGPGANTYTWLIAQQEINGSASQVRLERGSYSADVHIVNEHGCTSEQNILVNVDGGLEIYIPNSFSPNNDGNNDAWLPVGLEKCNAHSIQVFRAQDNTLVFETTEGSAWDGNIAGSTDLPQRGEQFIYRVIAEDACGEEQELKGSITVMQ
ncbi:MAG: gliding motility-associated C-terminal domain-containing protein [Flavobacteriales bacterium]|nr:gliding motility-associated C-terminal domain-containing protein [Flavobacteriales bacterium]